jgi:hypothetical protein
MFVRKRLTLGQTKVSFFCRKGHDAGDHPPITPMRPASRDELEGDSWRIYDYVVRHFLATVAPNCKYQVSITRISKVSGPILTIQQWTKCRPKFSGKLKYQNNTNLLYLLALANPSIKFKLKLSLLSFVLKNGPDKNRFYLYLVDKRNLIGGTKKP